MIIQHASENWNNFIPKNVKTLILGSFNPLNPEEHLNTDYYYGRSSNYFWKAIGDILYDNQQHYFNNGQLNTELAFQTMETYQFCFLDLISSIAITGNNEQHEINFVQERIYTNFEDSALFTTNTAFQNQNINIQRNYNQEILNFVQVHNPEKLIHTLGNNRITQNLVANPLENALLHNGFQGFINNILEVANYFESISYSPSGRAVRAGNQDYYQNLKNWLQENLNL